MIEWIKQFLEKFIGQPVSGEGIFSWVLIIRCESTHFLLSCFMGWLVFSLIWTIFSYNNYKCEDRFIFNISFVAGFLASVTTHIFIDGFTGIA